MNSALIALILVNIIVSYKGFQDIAFFRRNEFHIGSIRAGEHLRMFTSAFLHVDVIHLALNMYVLFIFAPPVMAAFGVFSFLTVYFGSLVFGNLLTLYLHNHDYSYRAVGASGAVTGIVYAFVLLFPDTTISLFFILEMPGYVFGLLYLSYSIYGMQAKGDNIGHAAHFGGAIGGYVITLCKQPAIFSQEPVVVALLALPIIAMFVLARLGKL